MQPDQAPSDRTVAVDRCLARPGHEAPSLRTQLRIANGRIAAIEPAADRAAGKPRLLALPALANAHDHGRGLRTLAFGNPDAPLDVWIRGLGQEPVVDPYLRAAVAFARMAESGICAANHCHNLQDEGQMLREAEGVARAAADVGIRIAFVVPFTSYGQPFEERLAIFDRIALLESNRFTVQYGPIGPQWIDEDALEALAARSSATGHRIHMHLFETQAQREWADTRYPEGYLHRLDGMGLLSERLTLAHVVWLRPDEARLLAERQVCVSLNPSSNLRLRSGLAPAQRMHEAGVSFGIGLDGMSLDDDEDMLREVRLLRHLANGISSGRHGQGVLTDAVFFDAALIDGRRSIVGEDGGGKLVVGTPADLVLLDFDALTEDLIVSDHDLAALLLTRMGKRHVNSLLVAGQMIVAKGCCTTVDRPALERELMALARPHFAAPA